jgi:hypothetical protein
MSDWERISPPTQAQTTPEPKTGDWERVQGNKPSGAYERFLDSLRNPQTSGRSGVVGPMLVGGTGELIKGAGALTQLAFPEAGNRMVEVGEAMTEGAKSVAPVSTTVGQIGSYLVPFTAAQKTATAIGNVPQVARTIGQLPSFARATGQQAAIGGALGYGLTPDQQNREQAALFGGLTGAATPFFGKAFDYVRDVVRGPQTTKGIQEAAKDVVQSGYVLPPTQVKPSLTNRLIEGIAGKTTTAQNASFINQQVTNKLAARSLGLPDDAVITPETLQNIRSNAGQAYENLRLSGRLKTSPKFIQALDNIGPYKDAKIAAKDFGDAKDNAVIEVIESLKKPSFDVNSAVSKINTLRTDANKAFKAGDTALYQANRQASEVLENTIENYLANSKQTDLLTKFRQARQTIAKTYSVEDALNPKTGTVDAKKLAAQLRGKKPLTGELKEIGEFGAAFPKAAQAPENMGSLTQISPLDYLATAGLGSIGASTGSLENTLMAGSLGLVRPAFRSAALSKPIQKGLSKQQMQNLSPETRNLAKMLIMQGAIKAGANEEQK